MVIPDPVTALCAYLRSDAELTVLVGTKVFGAELPENQNAAMPQRCVVLRRAGGGFLTGGYLRAGDFRLDCFCYGPTPYEAARVNLAVQEALKQMRRNVQGTALLHWANPSGGGINLRDPDAEWPLVFSSWQVFASEQEVPA